MSRAISCRKMPASPTSLANFDERRSEGRTRALSKMPRRFQSSEQSSIRNPAREGTNSINRVIKRRNDTPQKPRGNLRRKICAAQITLSVPGNKSSLIPSLVTAGWQRQFPAKNYHKIHGGHRHAHATSR